MKTKELINGYESPKMEIVEIVVEQDILTASDMKYEDWE